MAGKLNEPTVTPPIDTGIYRTPGDRWASLETHTPEALDAVAESIMASWHCPTLDEELRRIIGNARIGKADPEERPGSGQQRTECHLPPEPRSCHRRRESSGSTGVEVGTIDEQLLIKLAHEENAMCGKKNPKQGSKAAQKRTGRQTERGNQAEVRRRLQSNRRIPLQR